VTTPGAPPDVDVYVDDGRGGEYPYQQVFWENTDIWNRLNPDGGLTHETPIVGVSNYGYVRIKNRGTQAASSIVVSGFHCRPSTGLTWPDDWQAMTTASVNVTGTLAPGALVVVGPFEWVPSEIGHECMLMSVSADGDMSNIDPAGALPCAAGPTPHETLARFDNNIGQRNVAPVAGGGGLRGLIESFVHRQFWNNNPYNREIRVHLAVTLPKFLVQRGWQVVFQNPGGASFTLPPRGNRRIVIALKAGADFSAVDVVAAGKDSAIVVSAKTNGYVFGGMSYHIDPNLKTPPAELPTGGGLKKDQEKSAQELVSRLNLPLGEVRSVSIRSITVDIELKNFEC
jgi:hypothetical protein